MDHHGRVEQSSLGLERRSDDDHRLKRGALCDQRPDRLEHRVGQRLLAEQVIDRVSRQSQLGEHDHGRVLIRGGARELHRALGVERGVGDPHVGHGGGDAHEPVAVERMKGVHYEVTLATRRPRRCNSRRATARVCSFPARDRTPTRNRGMPL